MNIFKKLLWLLLAGALAVGVVSCSDDDDDDDDDKIVPTESITISKLDGTNDVTICNYGDTDKIISENGKKAPALVDGKLTFLYDAGTKTVKVYGKVKYIDYGTEFSSTPANQKGFFVPVKFTSTAAVKYVVTDSEGTAAGGNGKASTFTGSDSSYADGSVMRVAIAGDTAINGEKNYFGFFTGDAYSKAAPNLTLDYTAVTFTPEPAASYTIHAADGTNDVTICNFGDSDTLFGTIKAPALVDGTNGNRVSFLYDAGTKTVKVYGALKKITDAWTEFDPTSNNTGYFVPICYTSENDVTIPFLDDDKKAETGPGSKNITLNSGNSHKDGQVVRIGAPDATNFTFKTLVGFGTVSAGTAYTNYITLDFSTCTIKESE